MSAFAKKAIAQRKYMDLVHTIGNKPTNINLRYMNANEINKAFDSLLASTKTTKNISNIQYPSRSTIYKELKQRKIKASYKSSSAKELYDLLKETTGITLPLKKSKSRIMRNPITHNKLSKKGIQLFENLGYTYNNSKWSYPMDTLTISKIEVNDHIIYPINKKNSRKYKTGLITYRVINSIGDTLPTMTEGFKIINKNSATNKVNELIYYIKATYGEDYDIDIEKIELFTKKINGDFFGLAYRQFDIEYEECELPIKNCVILALETHLKKEFPKLHETYVNGVQESDYIDIAKTLGIVLRVNIMGQLKLYNVSKKSGIIDLKYLNNHVVANYSANDKTITKVQKLDTITINEIFSKDNINAIESVIKSGTTVLCINTINNRYQLSHQEFKNKKDSTFIEIQSDALTATTEYKKLFVEVNNIQSIYRNFEDAKYFARHGIKILKTGFVKGTTIDLRGAYTNFYKFPCYEGIPLDITFWVNGDADINIITSKYLGFGLVSNWQNYFTGELETRWASIPHIKSRMAKGYTFKVERWALSFAKGDLDLSMFEGMPKRLWHLVIGSMSRTEISESIATTDPILASSMGAYFWDNVNGSDIFIGEKEPTLCSSYIHVSATIQSYVEIMMEDKFDQMKNEINWWAIYVDGISTDGDVSKYVDEFWQRKSNVKFSMADETDLDCNAVDLSYTEIPIMDADIIALRDDELDNRGYESNETWDEWKLALSQIELKYQKIYEDKWADRKFIDIMVSGNGKIKIIDGPAGSGKSTLIKAIYKMCDTIILTPNNNQKIMFDGLNVETIDMYLTRMFSRGFKRYPFILIDEYTHMNPNAVQNFDRVLMFGNVAQLKIGKFLDYHDFDNHVLTKVYRCDSELERLAIESKKGHVEQFNKIDIIDALKLEHIILASTHKVIEDINDIALKMNLPRVIRFTTTNLKKDIFAGDMGILENGMCINNRNGNSYKMKVGRNPKKDLVVYGYARTYHATQGLEFSNVVCCIDNIKDWDMLYTGATRVHNLSEVSITSLVKPWENRCPVGYKGCKTVGPHTHIKDKVLIGKILSDAKFWYNNIDYVGPNQIMECGHMNCKFNKIKHTHIGDKAKVGIYLVPNWTYPKEI